MRRWYPSVFDSLLFDLEHDQRQRHDDQEQDDRLGGGAAEFIVEKRVAVDRVDDQVGGFARAALGQNLDLAEGLERLDDVDDERVEHDGAQTRQRQAEKLLHAVRAVHRGALVDGFVNVAKPGGEIQKVDAAVEPGGQHRHADQRVARVADPVDFQAGDLVEQADRGVQNNLEDHGRAAGGDGHRQRIGGAERADAGEGLAAQYRRHKPQQHAAEHDDDHKEQRDDDAVVKTFGSQQVDVVFSPDKNFGVAELVGQKHAQVDGLDKRIEQKHRKHSG